jgi:hypothetical protein
MKHLKSFNEAIREVSLIDTLKELRPYLTTEGVYTKYLLDSRLSGNRLYIELDITSAYEGGKNERDRIKRILTRAGFSPIATNGYFGGSTYTITIDDNNLEIVKNIISSN